MEEECYFTSESRDKPKEEQAVFFNEFGIGKDISSAGSPSSIIYLYAASYFLVGGVGRGFWGL